MRDVIRRRSTNWWKRKKKKRKESRAGITASCRLQLAFHVGGAASCAGPSLSLGRLTPGSRLTSTSTQAAMLMSVATLLPNAALGVSARVYP